MSRSHFGSVQREGEDRYRVWWSDGGKRRSKRIRGTRDDAEAYLASMVLRRGEPADMTWRDYWDFAVSPTFEGLAEKTVDGYERVWRVELEPRMGSRRVGSTNWHYVRPGDMRSVFATLHGEAGTPDSLVSMAMGHADDGSTKARNYQQRTSKGIVLAADSLTDYLSEAQNGL